jgi:hypothetical protein
MTGAIAALVAARPSVARWLAEATSRADVDALAAAFTGAARHVGRDPLVLDAADEHALAAAGVAWPLAWSTDELARVALLGRAGERLADDEFIALVERAYRHGDNRERQALLRALPFLPAPARFCRLAIDACRTHVQPIFEAIACENPYPATHFADLAFNQMALKAAFLGVALARIVALASRRTDELRRMADDFAAERRAAGRPVPPDLSLLGSSA